VPKGIVELGLSPMESAKKEALEEAGVNVSLGNNFLGSYSYKKWGGKCTVKVYAMEVRTVHDNWEEDFRERIWVNFNKIDEFIFSKKILRVISGMKFENFK
jgi:phosphohistidine phosphatase